MIAPAPTSQSAPTESGQVQQDETYSPPTAVKRPTVDGEQAPRIRKLRYSIAAISALAVLVMMFWSLTSSHYSASATSPDPPLPAGAAIAPAPVQAPRIVDTLARGSALIREPARTNESGLADALRRSNPFVAVAGVRVQSHQVTRREYAAYLATLPLARKAEATPLRGWREDHPDQPVGWTRFEQASGFCAAIGGRLPKLSEWERASGGAWGLDPTKTGMPGPLREWTSDVEDGWVRVAGAPASMAQAKRATVRSDPLLFASEARQQHGAAFADVDLASQEVGIRCITD